MNYNNRGFWRFKIIVFCFLCFLSCKEQEKPLTLLDNGIPQSLAIYRVKQVSDVVYNLDFKIPLKLEDSIASHLKLNLQVKDLEHPLYLDFNEDKSHIKHVEVNGSPISMHHEKEHLIIDQKHLKLGENTIDVAFLAGEMSLNRNKDYLYTLLVPDRASTLFPCFDQPDIKAKYELNIVAPKDWEVLCGAHLAKEEYQGDYKNYSFVTSDLMSTYLFSFVAGKFNKETQQIGDRSMTLLYRETDKDKLEASLDDIFKLHDASVNFLEDYTQYKFPFQKMDFASIPGFQYGGMEHVGAIQYREASVFLDKNATLNRKLSRGKLIAHETAHMWFGDLVTMKWFDDVWLKEVFANFLADKIANPTFPNINHNLNFISSHYPSAYSEDRTKGSTPIKQQLDNLKNAGTLYGRIIYNKAPIMMRQLEAVLGEDAFREGMRNYIKTYANSNADWNDLVALLDEQTDVNIKQWSKVWVYESGRPMISDNIIYDNNKIKTFEISQKAEDGSDKLWPQSFDIGLVYKNSIQVVPVKLEGKNLILDEVTGLPKPEFIIYNYNGLGYGVFPIKNQAITYIPEIKDDVARAYSYINLYENVLSGNINPESALSLMVEGAKTEKVELVLDIISGYISSVFWKYITEDKRPGLGELYESDLKERLIHGKDLPGIKKTLYNTYRSIAFSNAGKEVLYKIWNKSLDIPGLNLSQNDYTSLASTLAVYKHAKSEEILAKAKDQIVNPDRKKRFEFILPSLSDNVEERDVFMQSLAQAKQREKESWVLAALNNIHHPLRQKESQKHLNLCLELLEEIQLTGDIFFPKGWLNATIGNYTSEHAYRTVEHFLNMNPEFPRVLKNKLLQSADGVYRAAKIKED